jgi:hypothetical protein
MTALLAKKVEF